MSNEGVIYRISGPVVTAIGMNAAMYDVVRVGHEGLMGEVIELHGEKAVIQVYEDTSGIRPGEPVLNTEETLSVSLGSWPPDPNLRRYSAPARLARGSDGCVHHPWC